MSTEHYEIRLPQFEGPFDLLLFFIERDELDIYDIPIAKITDDFLNYIRQMDRLNVEVASEFILVAASLMRIKAKMLLPRKEINPETGEEIDPREELVKRLIEYKKFKEVSDTLKLMEEERHHMIPRGNIDSELKIISELYSNEAELHSLSFFRLLKAFKSVLERVEREKNKPIHEVISYPYTIGDCKKSLKEMCGAGQKIPFERVFEGCEGRIHAIFIFLSLLELVAERYLNVDVGADANQFWLSGNEYAELEKREIESQE